MFWFISVVVVVFGLFMFFGGGAVRVFVGGFVGFFVCVFFNVNRMSMQVRLSHQGKGQNSSKSISSHSFQQLRQSQ